MNLSRTLVRRLIFLLVFLAVALPLIFDFSLVHTATPETEQAFANIDSLQRGDIILISFDFEASSLPEVAPLAEAIIAHAFRKQAIVVGVSLFAEGTALGEQMLRRAARAVDAQYGRDYAYLGFRPQYQAAILGMGESIVAEFPRDYYGRPTQSLPVFARLKNYEEVELVVSIADGSMPTYWAEYAVAPYSVRLQVALTATMATAFYPYLSSGQIIGLLAGLKGAAEYEKMLELAGGGQRGLFALSTSQSLIILIVIAANVAEFSRRRRS
jgi:hypothetical protein